MRQNINQKIEFLKILLANFISQIGGHFLTLSITSFILLKTDSTFQMGLVLFFSFLPNFLFGSKMGEIVDKYFSKRFLILIDLFSILVTVIVGVAIYVDLPLFILCLLMSIRTIFQTISMCTIQKWVKIITPPNIQEERFKLLSFVFFISTAVSGILAGMVLSYGSIVPIITIDVISYLVAIVIYYTFQNVKVEKVSEKSNISISSLIGLSTLLEIFSSVKLRLAFMFVILSQAMFQGSYYILVTFIPIKKLGLGTDYISYFQLAASCGIIVGFFIISSKKLKSTFIDNLKSNFLGPIALFMFGVVSLFMVSWTEELKTSLFFFFLLNTLYECIWLQYRSSFLKNCSTSNIGRFSYCLTTYAAFFMSLSTLLLSFLVEKFNISVSSLIFSIVILILLLFLWPILLHLTSTRFEKLAME